MLVSSPWHCKMCSRFASKRGGCPKAVLVSSGGAQNCASKLRVTILLRDPLTIPAKRRPKVKNVLNLHLSSSSPRPPPPVHCPLSGVSSVFLFVIYCLSLREESSRLSTGQVNYVLHNFLGL